MKYLASNSFLLGLLLLSSCATKAPTAGNYSGFYEIPATDKITCHFLVKKEKPYYPSVVCHDAEQAWVVPLKDMPGQVWVTAPILTQSGTMIAVTDTDKKYSKRVNVLMSTDQGRDWQIQPLFLKKKLNDRLEKISINKDGKLVATYLGASGKNFDVLQAATLKAKFTEIKSVAKSYDPSCFSQHNQDTTVRIPEVCMTGYLKRLLNQ